MTRSESSFSSAKVRRKSVTRQRRNLENQERKGCYRNTDSAE